MYRHPLNEESIEAIEKLADVTKDDKKKKKKKARRGWKKSRKRRRPGRMRLIWQC
jgi:hypothetical protein